MLRTTRLVPRRPAANMLAGATLATAAAACVLAAPAAHAGSLVFVKDHNVWLAADDGTGQYQVTLDGTSDNPYVSPSQSDDGTIVAGRSKPNNAPLVRLKQSGDLINEIKLDTMQFGPWDPAVSPDGKTVAYTHGYAAYVNYWLETSSNVRYASTTQFTPNGTYPAVSTGASTPSWIDSSTSLVGRGSVGYRQTLGSPAQQWWSDYDHYSIFGQGQDLLDGELAADRLVMVRGMSGETVVSYSVAAGQEYKPQYDCSITNPAAGPNGTKFADPTLSADGRRLWVQQGDGIYLLNAPAPEGKCGEWTEQKLIAGASQPDWSPAAANPGARTVAADPKSGNGAAGGGGAQGGGTAGGAPAGGNSSTPGGGGATGGAGSACTARTGAKREQCVYDAAAAKCKAIGKKSKRSACLTKAKRDRLTASCKRTKKGKALKACLKTAAKAKV